MWWNLHLPLHWGTWNNYIYILRTTQRTNTGQVLRIGGSWGILSIVKSLQKQLQKRHKHRCLKIDNTSPKIDIFFEQTVLSLLPPTGNNAQVWFLIHQVLTTSATVLQYRQMFTHALFPPCSQVRIYVSFDKLLLYVFTVLYWTPCKCLFLTSIHSINVVVLLLFGTTFDFSTNCSSLVSSAKRVQVLFGFFSATENHHCYHQKQFNHTFQGQIFLQSTFSSLETVETWKTSCNNCLPMFGHRDC